MTPAQAREKAEELLCEIGVEQYAMMEGDHARKRDTLARALLLAQAEAIEDSATFALDAHNQAEADMTPFYAKESWQWAMNEMGEAVNDAFCERERSIAAIPDKLRDRAAALRRAAEEIK